MIDASDVAICVVHGRHGPYCEKDALRYSWPRLQLERIRRHTPPGYRVFVFGLARDNRFLPEDAAFLRACPEVTFIPCAGVKHGRYPFSWPLMNWLTYRVLESHRVIVHLAPDAFPVADDWLPRYAERLDDHTPVVAVRLADPERAQAGAVCVMFTAGGMRRYGFDFSPVGVAGVGGRIPCCVEEAGAAWHGLSRSNRVNYDPCAAALYDDRIYHHGAPACRPDGGAAASPDAGRVSALLADRLFRDSDRFLDELRGRAPAADIAALLAQWRPAPYPLSYHPAWRLARRLLRIPLSAVWRFSHHSA